MHRNEAGLEELRTADSQYAFRPIDVFGLEPCRLIDAHAGRRQKTEDRVQDPRFEAVSCHAPLGRRDPEGRGKQPSYFLIGIDVGPKTAQRWLKQTRWRDLDGRVHAGEVLSEPTHGAQVSDLRAWRPLLLLGRKLECEGRSNVRSPFFIQIREEASQPGLKTIQLVPKIA